MVDTIDSIDTTDGVTPDPHDRPSQLVRTPSPMLDSPVLERRLQLDPQVALRREPFGALAYHYGNRRLIFLRHPDIVDVVAVLGDHDTVADALRACGIARTRWPSFAGAIGSLLRSELLRERPLAG